jgi:hypothetical protein
MSDVAAMLLYHHTNHRVLPVIRREWLTEGRIVLDENRQVAAISLTSSPTPEGLGLNFEDESLNLRPLSHPHPALASCLASLSSTHRAVGR